MLTVHLGWVGFHFGLTTKGVKDERIFILFLGVVGVCWWNAVAGRLYMRCLRFSISDAALVADAPSVIHERVEEQTAKVLAEQRESHEFWQAHQMKEMQRLEKQNMEANGKIHDLKTALRELAWARENRADDSR